MAIATNYPGGLDDDTSIPSPYTYTYLGETSEPHAHRETHLAVADAVKALEVNVGTTSTPHTVVTFATDAARDASTVANGTVAWTTASKTLKLKVDGAWKYLGQAVTTVNSGATAEPGWSLDAFNGWRYGATAQFKVTFTRTGADVNPFSQPTVLTLPTLMRGNIVEAFGCSQTYGPQLLASFYNCNTGVLRLVGSSAGTISTGNQYGVSFSGLVDV